MKPATVVVVLLFLSLSVFALLNWSAIVEPSSLSFGLGSVYAPLGLILLAGAGLLTATFLVFALYQQAAALVDSRRFARDLHEQRKLADEAEASRFTALREYLDGELRALQERATAEHSATDARLGRIEEALAMRLAEVGNAISAHVSELEDKVDGALRSH